MAYTVPNGTRVPGGHPRFLRRAEYISAPLSGSRVPTGMGPLRVGSTHQMGTGCQVVNKIRAK